MTSSRLAEDSLLWEPPPMDPELAKEFSEVLPQLDLSWGMAIDRAKAFQLSRRNAGLLKNWLVDPNQPRRKLLRQILEFEEPDKQWKNTLRRSDVQRQIGPSRSILCGSVGGRPGRIAKSTLVIEITQTFQADPDKIRYRGGCTLLFDLNSARLDYVVRKRLLSPWSFKNQGKVQLTAMKAAADEGQIYYAPDGSARPQQDLRLDASAWEAGMKSPSKSARTTKTDSGAAKATTRKATVRNPPARGPASAPVENPAQSADGDAKGTAPPCASIARG